MFEGQETPEHSAVRSSSRILFDESLSFGAVMRRGIRHGEGGREGGGDRDDIVLHFI